MALLSNATSYQLSVAGGQLAARVDPRLSPSLRKIEA
jgi:hypothetical protein